MSTIDLECFHCICIIVHVYCTGLTCNVAVVAFHKIPVHVTRIQCTCIQRYAFCSPTGEPPRNAKINSSKSPNHQVSAPLPPAGVPLSERFKPIENGLGGDSIYSLAVAEQQSVHKQLSNKPEIPAGVSLSEALATKGMGTGRRPVSTSSRASFDSSSLSDATINRLSGMSDSHYFAPRSYESGAYFEAGMDPHSLYASPTNNAPLLNVSPGRFDSKSRAATMLPPMTDPLAPDSRHRGLTSTASYGGRSAVASGSGAQMLENGYMKPRPCPDRVPDYDYPPLGPPRPADQSSGNVSPPRQHRSALLNRSGSGSPTSPDDPHTYMNVSAFHEGLPPPIDRTNKPPPPQPPRVDRQLKPSRKQDVQLEDDSPLPPNKDSPSFPRRAGSLSGSPEEEQGFFADSDVPRRTSKSTTYVQVQFDPESRRPIPLPRSGPQGKPSRPRVEYADVDLVATRQLSEENERLRIEEQKKLFERQKVTLRGAEKEYLAEKDYVNLDREGQVDDDTNPDYYTFMRVSDSRGARTKQGGGRVLQGIWAVIDPILCQTYVTGAFSVRCY